MKRFFLLAFGSFSLRTFEWKKGNWGCLKVKIHLTRFPDYSLRFRSCNDTSNTKYFSCRVGNLVKKWKKINWLTCNECQLSQKFTLWKNELEYHINKYKYLLIPGSCFQLVHQGLNLDKMPIKSLCYGYIGKF